MRKLGLIGGMTWISTRTYYEALNRLVQKRLGPGVNPPLVIESLQNSEFGALEDDGDWSRAAGLLADCGRRLEQAGAEGLLITSNIMHKVYDQVAEAVGIPILHIGDCTGERMQKSASSPAAILGTRAVMTDSFMRRRLVSHGIDLMPPEASHIDQLDRIIGEELKLGKKTREAERVLKTIITWYEQHGAESVVLACTELELVVDIDANILPIFDTAQIHCEAAVEWMCAE